MKKLIILCMVILLVSLPGALLVSCQEQAPAPTFPTPPPIPEPTPTPPLTPEPTPTPTPTPAPTPPPKTITIEDTDPAFAWEGSWEKQDNLGASGGTWHLTPPEGKGPVPGAKATVTFTGTQVSLIHITAPHCGIAEINIDGTAYSPVDMYSAEIKVKVKTVIATDLSEGQHVLTVIVSDRKNLASKRYVVAIDAIEVTE